MGGLSYPLLAISLAIVLIEIMVFSVQQVFAP